MIRAKFRVNYIARGNEYERISMTPVYSADPNSENAKWSKATPFGELNMHITNPDALGQFEEGKEYYLDFTPASVAEPA